MTEESSPARPERQTKLILAVALAALGVYRVRSYHPAESGVANPRTGNPFMDMGRPATEPWSKGASLNPTLAAGAAACLIGAAVIYRKS